MDWDKIDWDALERMRKSFLAGSAGRGDYWHGETDLAAYDATFAQRIGWKWDFVLDELSRRGWRPPAGEVLDWGCGSGIAGRRFLTHFADHVKGPLVLHDRSTLAMEFAVGRARAEFPSITVRCEAASGASATTLLVSHVLSELTDRQLECLLSQVGRATAVLWVEPGTHENSRRLGTSVRERLRKEFSILAPCTHQAACGLLTGGMERHWCHHFADTPSEVFMDGNWSRFARLAGIDLRSLPLSFLVLDRRGYRSAPPVAAASPGDPASHGTLPLPPGAVRVIGRPRVHKDAARPFGCDAFGVRERRLAKRAFPQEYRACKRGDFDTLQAWTLDGDEIVAISEWE